ncbi:Predicted Fe-Mo cluster-binding protein, NifX family [Lutibacter oricola]|uniref:Predicted Fe-Mo cluster-binding protein, NifX family n=1 Tax=Lutibacter oricola TaxID=762486 RepID=A0A1H2T541_9FLAO|nr:NifB/NifX family molybdenum-iron cluster-binding protein [Lutibacter oricola]SDW38992.1 Predicted Fe-Mo cluster-binding protein, NifX family [Lutibacter oricola]
MKIALPTNDRKSIAKRTGRASEFAFYTINNGIIESVKYVKNTNSHDHDRNEGHLRGENDEHNHIGHKHEHGEHNHDELLDILVDIDLLLVRAVGKYMRKTLQKGSFEYKLVKTDAISELLEDYLKTV